MEDYDTIREVLCNEEIILRICIQDLIPFQDY